MFVGNINLPKMFRHATLPFGPGTMHLGLRTSSLGLRAPLPASVTISRLHRVALAHIGYILSPLLPCKSREAHVKIQKLPSTFVQNA